MAKSKKTRLEIEKPKLTTVKDAGVKQVWHYTDAAALIGMLQNQRMWASSASMLNDSQELAYGLDLATEIIDKAKGPAADDKSIEVGALRAARHALIDTNSVFVVCAATERDDLSQWRAYAPNGGVAIGMEPRPLRVVINNADSINDAKGSVIENGWRMVEYDRTIQRSLIEKWIKYNTVSLNKGINRDLAQAEAKQLLINLVVGFKHPGFAAEREARIAFEDTVADLPVQFRAAKLGVLPYVELGYRRDRGKFVQVALSSQCSALPIREILIGPNPNMEASKGGVEKLLSLLGSHGPKGDVKVTMSKVPYRT